MVNTDYVQLGPDDGIAQASNSSFDAATFEIWGALLNGARLVFVSTDTLLSPAALARAIDAQRITTMFVTTALFNEHAASAPAAFAGLRTLLFGGEAVDPQAVRRIVESTPPQRLLHVYGPTETTTFATWHEVALRGGYAERRTVPIGKPIANTHCRILDASLEPVPVGAIGELYVGGPGLARGYLHRPELTAERFVADPLQPGERLYRTGDLARYRADGNIDYAGRIDRQVKLRGFRIELGEIEAAIASEPGVTQCIVVVREDRPGNRRLVAYAVAAVAADAAVAPSPAGLCHSLAARLPAYMVPSSVVMLDALPLTPNGKVDRAALPAPVQGSGGDAAHQDTAPADDLEQQLRAIWEDVLGVAPVHAHHDFFELGGHSLLAIKLLDRIDKQFGRALGLATLFQAPTLGAQAALLRREDWQAPSHCAVAVRAEGRRPPLFFVSGYGGAILPFHALARELDAEQPLYVLDVNSITGLDGSPVVLEALAADMIRDLRSVQPRGPYHLAGFSLGGKIVYEMAQQLQHAGETVGLLALLDCAAPGAERLLSFPVRVWLHVKHALRHDPREAVAYLIERVRRLKKYVGLADRVEPKVFKSHEAIDPTTIVRSIEARARPLYDAWLAYQPRPYAGSLLLIRAEVRDYMPGVVADDRSMGWGRLITRGVDIVSLHDARHEDMLDAQHSRALAALLDDAIARSASRR